tara:strand:+ start:309 stop:503 length:195 start_codon:yes stop_codon:yes gene_type:complete
LDVLGLQIVSLSGLIVAASREVKGDAQFQYRQRFLDQDDDVTSAPDPLSNPQSRRKPTEVHYVA